MKIKESIWPVLLASMLGAAACSNPQKSRILTHTQNIPAVDALNSCTYTNNDVDHHYEFDIKQTSSPSVISVFAWEYDLDPNGVQINKIPYLYTADTGHIATPLNMNLQLDTSKRKKVMIHFILDSSTPWHFAGNNLGVTSNEAASRKDMFCLLKSTPNTVDFGVQYKNAPKPGDTYTYAFYNTNIIIPLNATTTNPAPMLPLTIDPEVKNNG
jgi:hypothetical protein